MERESKLAEALRGKDMSGLIDALRHQRQIDAHGTEVGVSRQAVDEAAEILDALAAHDAREGERAERPCSLAEALNVIEAWGMRGNTLHGDDVLRFRTLADKIAPRTGEQPQPSVADWVMVPARISEVEADLIGMPVKWYERAVATASRMRNPTPYTAAPQEKGT